MDELAYSINGENVHYGTPANPAAPARIPGGSSSGSAVRRARQRVHSVEAPCQSVSDASDTAATVQIFILQ